jgi:hypothetical protein
LVETVDFGGRVAEVGGGRRENRRSLGERLDSHDGPGEGTCLGALARSLIDEEAVDTKNAHWGAAHHVHH